MGFLPRTKSIVGLDIGSYSVKAVELSKTNAGLVLTGFGRERIEGPEEAPDVIRQVLRDAGIRSRRVVTGVSGRSVIVRDVPMPAMDDSELRQAIYYEADKYIPFEVDEVQLDCHRIEEDSTSSDQMRVKLVAVKQTLVHDHIQILRDAGLQPVIIDVDQFALGNCFELRAERLGQVDEANRGLVEIGASKTTISILRGTKTRFTREIFMAGNDLTEAVAKRFGEDPKDVERMKEDPGGALETMQDAMMQVLEDIGSEIRMSFDYYEGQFDQEVKEVYLSGGSVQFQDIDAMLSNIFNMDVRLWDPSESVEISPSLDATLLSGHNSDLAIAIGLASRLQGL